MGVKKKGAGGAGGKDKRKMGKEKKLKAAVGEAVNEVEEAERKVPTIRGDIFLFWNPILFYTNTYI